MMPSIQGFAALRAPHPSSPARRGGAKQIEAQRPAAFRAFSVQGLTGAGLPTALHEKSPALRAELQMVCGEGGIRTPGASQLNSFQDCRNRPLYHLSRLIPSIEGMQRYIFFFVQQNMWEYFCYFLFSSFFSSARVKKRFWKRIR